MFLWEHLPVEIVLIISRFLSWNDRIGALRCVDKATCLALSEQPIHALSFSNRQGVESLKRFCLKYSVSEIFNVCIPQATMDDIKGLPVNGGLSVNVYMKQFPSKLVSRSDYVQLYLPPEEILHGLPYLPALKRLHLNLRRTKMIRFAAPFYNDQGTALALPNLQQIVIDAPNLFDFRCLSHLTKVSELYISADKASTSSLLDCLRTLAPNLEVLAICVQELDKPSEFFRQLKQVHWPKLVIYTAAHSKMVLGNLESKMEFLQCNYWDSKEELMQFLNGIKTTRLVIANAERKLDKSSDIWVQASKETKCKQLIIRSNNILLALQTLERNPNLFYVTLVNLGYLPLDIGRKAVRGWASGCQILDMAKAGYNLDQFEWDGLVLCNRWKELLPFFQYFSSFRAPCGFWPLFAKGCKKALPNIKSIVITKKEPACNPYCHGLEKHCTGTDWLLLIPALFPNLKLMFATSDIARWLYKSPPFLQIKQQYSGLITNEIDDYFR